MEEWKPRTSKTRTEDSVVTARLGLYGTQALGETWRASGPSAPWNPMGDHSLL